MANKSRSKKAVVNTIAGIMSELVSLICGLILPRLILTSFGSAYNGITSSITQFISCISLMKAGVGGVTRAALYKPLAENNTQRISAIVVQTEKFMRRIALLFVGFVLVFAVVYPILISTDFEWLFSFSLILIISISTFVQYYFGLTYQMVLNADQRQIIPLMVSMGTTILNTIVSVVLINIGASIHMVKLGSSVVFIIGPLFICNYTRKRYRIDRTINVKEDLIKQRWDAVGHEISNFVNNNTDIIILTLFAGLHEVSVYTVYHYVIVNIRKIVVNFITGFGAAFGNMYALKQYDLMQKNLKLYELIVFSLTSVIYAVALVMIVPFAEIYTVGVTDVEYYRPVFGIVLTLGGAFSCFRIPYETVVKAVGHYKQTRNGALAEAIIHIMISVICVIKFGIIGVAIGALLAAVIRTIQYALYLGKNVLQRSMFLFIRHVITALGIYVFTCLISKMYMTTVITVWQWVEMALITTFIACALTLFTDVVFYFNEIKSLMKKIIGMYKKRR